MAETQALMEMRRRLAELLGGSASGVPGVPAQPDMMPQPMQPSFPGESMNDYQSQNRFGADPQRNMGIPEWGGGLGGYLGNLGRGIGMVASPMIGIPMMAAQGMMGQGVSGSQAPMGLLETAGRAARQAVDPYTGLPVGGGGGGNDRGSNPNDLGRTGYTSGMREPKTGRMVGGV